MGLVAPDILEEVRGLSWGANLIGLFLGLALWLFGWRGYRFWVVLAVTVTAGVFGLSSGAQSGTQPMVIGLLLALAAGMLALSLARFGVFVIGGLLTAVVVQALVPALKEPWLVCFLLGGLVSLLLFRLWTMVLTSFAGSLLVAYCGLGLADRVFKFGVVEFAQKQTEAINGVFAGVALTGFFYQFIMDRRLLKKGGKGKPKGSAPKKAEGGGDAPVPLLGWIQSVYKRAG